MPTTFTGRPKQFSTSSTKTAAGGSARSRRSTSAGTWTGAMSRARISSHRNWLALARTLAGRYRRKDARRRSGPFVLARSARFLHWLLQRRHLTLFLLGPGRRGFVSSPRREIAASSAPAGFPARKMLYRRETRRVPVGASEGNRSACPPDVRHAWRKGSIITTVAVRRASTVERRVAGRRAPFDPSIPVQRLIAAEAARFGRRTRHRRSRSEERRAGVTTTVIERATSSRSQSEKGAMSREELPPRSPGPIPGAWETRSPHAIDVSRLTDEVLTQIDRRVVARRERLGRI